MVKKKPLIKLMNDNKVTLNIKLKRRKLTLNRTEQNRTMSELVLLDSLTCEDPFDVSKRLVY